MEKSKKRAPNFNDQERKFLLALVKKYKHVIEAKGSSSHDINKKNVVWAAICREYNSLCTTGPRSTAMLKHFYFNIKHRSRVDVSLRNELNDASLGSLSSNDTSKDGCDGNKDQISNVLKNLKHARMAQYGLVLENQTQEDDSDIRMESVEIKSRGKTGSSDFSDDSENDEPDLDVDSELWAYFEKESDRWVKCSMCGQRLKQEVDTLYKHLKEVHSVVTGNKDENYTEVIYLEDPIQSQEERLLKEVQPKGLKRTRNYTSDEAEISDFGLYITSLLRDLPRNVCAQLQLNIVDLIVKAKLEETGPDICMEVDRGKDPMENKNQQNTKTTKQPENPEISTESQNEMDTKTNKTPKKRTKLKNDSSNENIIENFGNYVVCLLKTFPRTDTNTKLQKDIVDLIMTARLQTMKNRLTDNAIDKLGVRQDLFVEIK
ncbi:uncharacterized protein LOC123718217 [Pieris brassicae]|uniref:Regulatory protein zeste n=1 Tax=Pieris brassicae TaxID=7116 RepID=A0A9P0XDK6_PIEBR|nr:uncharacterized protein LOC123718217 [Pieris brassicae]CAH4034356.1 unnamed protein product [Pieris brassicae]